MAPTDPTTPRAAKAHRADRRRALARLALGGVAGLAGAAGTRTVLAADAVERLRAFVREVKGGEAPFTQTVVSADGKRRKTSSGRFSFLRPNRFRFAYDKPAEQLIVSDGQKVWIYDADLKQATSRPLARALGQTPAALLAGASPDQDFVLTNEGTREGLDWLRAAPKAKEGAGFQALRVGFRGAELAAVEIVDNFGQRSLLQFGEWATGAAATPPAERFRFVPPAGAEVVEQ